MTIFLLDLPKYDTDSMTSITRVSVNFQMKNYVTQKIFGTGVHVETFDLRKWSAIYTEKSNLSALIESPSHIEGLTIKAQLIGQIQTIVLKILSDHTEFTSLGLFSREGRNEWLTKRKISNQQSSSELAILLMSLATKTHLLMLYDERFQSTSLFKKAS